MASNFIIIDEQPEFIIVYKPENISFHDDENIGSGFFNQIKNQLNYDDLFPVHRLDKMTSGLMILAKSKSAAQQFQHLFSQHLIDKYYLAISDKKPKKKQGLIKGDMAKSRRGSWKLLHSTKNPAITQFFSFSLGLGKRLYLLRPLSGKTHQIRVALNSIGAPIIGDNIYNASSASDRGYLHAYALSFSFNSSIYQYIMPPKSGEIFATESTSEVIKNQIAPWTLNWPRV